MDSPFYFPKSVFYKFLMPITVATGSKAWTVFASSNTGVMGSNPTRSMHVCVRLFCVCVVLCAGMGVSTGWSPSKESYRLCTRLRNWKSSQDQTAVQSLKDKETNFSFSNTCYKSHSVRLPSFYRPNHTWWGLKTTKLFIIKMFFLHIPVNYCLWNPVIFSSAFRIKNNCKDVFHIRDLLWIS
jgi:hypothetical protein